MKLLLDGTRIIAHGGDFKFQIYDEPDLLKWGQWNENGEFEHLCFIDNNYTVDIVNCELPEDFNTGKYLWINGEFVEDPDWVEPPLPIEQQVEILNENVSELNDDTEIISECLDEVAVEIEEQVENNTMTSECLDELLLMLEELSERLEALEN